MKFRGALVIALAGTSLLAAEVVQRTLIVAGARLFPGRRHHIFAAWQQRLARLLLGIVRVAGGARFEDIPQIPSSPGVLVMMNHQSLMDIPLVVRATRDSYPRIVTRDRYARGKPLISHMVRLYQYPTVNPKAMTRSDLELLQQRAAESPVPIAIFPEGTRTRDGTIGRFKRTGLRLILGTRKWEVWLVVADGWWQAARLTDFVGNISSVRGRIRAVGPFSSPDPEVDPETFIREMEDRMNNLLEELRKEHVDLAQMA